MYEDLCRFFADYVFSGAGVPEPPEGEYRTVLSAADRCVRNEPALTTDDGLYLRLTLYSGIAGMLKEFRQGFAREGAAESEVTGLLAMIRNRTEKMEPSRETLTALRETVLEECRQAVEKIRQTYGNIQLWEGG